MRPEVERTGHGGRAHPDWLHRITSVLTEDATPSHTSFTLKSAPTINRKRVSTVTATKTNFRLFVTVALALAAGTSQAALVSSNSLASLGPLVGTDTFSDLTINTFTTGPLARSTGSSGSSGTLPANYTGALGTGSNYAYTMTTSGGEFFVVPNAGNPGVSTEFQTSSITFSFTDTVNSVFSFGGNFSGTGNSGETIAGGAFRLIATNSLGESLTQNFTTAGFYGFKSGTGARLTSVVLSSTNATAYATIDNLALSPSSVPTPDSYGLMLAGLGALAFAGRRRRQD